MNKSKFRIYEEQRAIETYGEREKGDKTLTFECPIFESYSKSNIHSNSYSSPSLGTGYILFCASKQSSAEFKTITALAVARKLARYAHPLQILPSIVLQILRPSPRGFV